MNRTMSHYFNSKYGILGILLTFLTFPAFAYSGEISSLPTATVQQGLPNQDAMNEKAVEFNKDYFKGYVTDFKSIITSPARWDTTDWITATLVTGAAIGLYENDAKIQKWFQDHETTTTKNIGENATMAGCGALTLPIVGGMYLYGSLPMTGKCGKQLSLLWKASS